VQARRLVSADPRFGVTWCVGVPHCGKTTLAMALAFARAAKQGQPCVVVDAGGVRQFADMPHVVARSMPQAVWGGGMSVAVTPSDREEADAIFRAVYAGRDVVLLVDEAHYWMTSSSSRQSELLKLMRATQHARIHVYLTTQHLTGDVPQAALSCAPTLYVMRSTAPAVLKKLEEDFRLDPKVVENLERGCFLRVSQAFGEQL